MAEQYPSPRAGQKVTGEFLSSMLPQTVRKVADTARTVTTPLDDPELQITVVANAVYTIDGLLHFSSSADSVDVTIDWTAPTGADGSWSGIGQPTGATGTDGTVRTMTTSITANRAYGTDDASNLSIVVNTLLIVGSTAGTYALNWNPANAGTCTMLTDSYLVFRRIA